jgi:hypothetical protein
VIAVQVLPVGRWLPGLGWQQQDHRHLVLAGTPALPDEIEHYPAVCGAETLRMPTSPPRMPYAYELLPRCPACRRWRAGA